MILWPFVCKFLFQQQSSDLLGMYLGVKLLGHVVILFNFLGKYQPVFDSPKTFQCLGVVRVVFHLGFGVGSLTWLIQAPDPSVLHSWGWPFSSPFPVSPLLWQLQTLLLTPLHFCNFCEILACSSYCLLQIRCSLNSWTQLVLITYFYGPLG